MIIKCNKFKKDCYTISKKKKVKAAGKHLSAIDFKPKLNHHYIKALVFIKIKLGMLSLIVNFYNKHSQFCQDNNI